MKMIEIFAIQCSECLRYLGTSEKKQSEVIFCSDCSTKKYIKKTSNHNQRKKDKDDGSNVSLSGTPNQLQGKNNKDEHMLASVDRHVDTDDLTNPSLDEVSRIDGCRQNPQDDPGKASGADNGDTGDGTFPADLKLFKKAGQVVIAEDKKLLEELGRK